jgi:error-prone DNA polymerase
MERHRVRLLAGMHKSGLTPEYAERVFQQIQGFGSYGFPESHAAAFAQLAYVSAYLKRHYPCAFACALLNSQPMGFYSPAIIVNDFKRHGGSVRPVDVQHSDWDTTLEEGGLRIGLRQIRGLGEETGQAIVRARAEGGAFRSMEDFARRVALPTKALVPLAAGGALRGFSPRRREAIWRASDIVRRQGTLFAGIGEGEAPPKSLPPLYLGERLTLDSVYTGTFPDRHPMELVREELTRAGVLSARALADADLTRRQTVAGLVITRQRPQTASGMVFMTLEDETGQVDVSVLSAVFERFQPVIRFSVALIVEGRVVADGNARNVMAADIRPLTIGNGLQIVSHDFH